MLHFSSHLLIETCKSVENAWTPFTWCWQWGGVTCVARIGEGGHSRWNRLAPITRIVPAWGECFVGRYSWWTLYGCAWSGYEYNSLGFPKRWQERCHRKEMTRSPERLHQQVQTQLGCFTISEKAGAVTGRLYGRENAWNASIAYSGAGSLGPSVVEQSKKRPSKTKVTLREGSRLIGRDQYNIWRTSDSFRSFWTRTSMQCQQWLVAEINMVRLLDGTSGTTPWCSNLTRAMQATYRVQYEAMKNLREKRLFRRVQFNIMAEFLGQ